MKNRLTNWYFKKWFVKLFVVKSCLHTLYAYQLKVFVSLFLATFSLVATPCVTCACFMNTGSSLYVLLLFFSMHGVIYVTCNGENWFHSHTVLSTLHHSVSHGRCLCEMLLSGDIKNWMHCWGRRKLHVKINRASWVARVRGWEVGERKWMKRWWETAKIETDRSKCRQEGKELLRVKHVERKERRRERRKDKNNDERKKMEEKIERQHKERWES